MTFNKAGISIQAVSRLACIGLAVVLLAGCRLVLKTDETGSIQSASGANDCSQGTCTIPINGPFEDSFTAVPAARYRFVKWTGAYHNDLLVSILNGFGGSLTTYGEPTFCRGPLSNLT